MLKIIYFLLMVELSQSFDVLSDLGYEDPLTNYADNFNNRISGLAQECTANIGEFGTCRNSVYCHLLGGTPSGRGSCSSIFDSCCRVNRGCGRTTKTKISTFVSPTTVPQEGGECFYTAYMINSNICQVRIDFNTSMSKPQSERTGVNEGLCMSDRITFEDGQDYQTPVICGENINQHLYLRVDSTKKSIRIRAHFVSGGVIASSPTWMMKVTQLECPGRNTELLNPYHRTQAAVDYPKLAPRGCIQYFTATEGTFRSFNSNGQAVTTTEGAFYEPFLEYSMCFYRPPNSCRVQITVTGALDPAADPDLPTTVLYASELTEGKSLVLLPPPDNTVSKDTYGPFYIKFKSMQASGIGFEITYNTDLSCGGDI